MAAKMIETLLNVTWLLVAAASFAAVLPKRRDVRTMAALALALVLLFPIISITDDFLSERGITDAQAFAVLAAFVLLIGLVAIARLSAAQVVRRSQVAVISSDPRSPPRV